MTLEKFLKTLGSESPSPGGGAAAALTGALGSALLEMVCRLNDKRHNERSAKLKKISRFKTDFIKLMSEDERGFQKLSKLMKTKKRGPVLQSALKNCTKAPLAMGKACVEALDLGISEIPRTSRWLSSDLVEAGVLLESAAEAARLNVEINLKSIEDKAFVEKTRKQLSVISTRFKRCALRKF